MKLRWVYLRNRILQLRGRSGGVVSGKVSQGEVAHTEFIKKFINSVQPLLLGLFSRFAQAMDTFNRRKSGKITLFKSSANICWFRHQNYRTTSLINSCSDRKDSLEHSWNIDVIKTRTVQLLQFCDTLDRVKKPASFWWLPGWGVSVAQMVTEKGLLDDGVNMKIYDDAFFVEAWA